MATKDYVRGGGAQIFQQPFNALGVEYYGFIFNADPKAIQTNFCDRFFNQPSGGAVDFAPFGPWFILAFNNLASLASTNPPDSQKGWFTERESATWVLLEERKSKNLYWFLPYIYVDNAYALCMGRETYGFPKGLGQFDISYFPEFATYFAMDTIVLDKYSPITKGAWENLWKVTKSDPAMNLELTLSKDFEFFAKAMVGVFKDLAVHPVAEIEKLWAFLKEILHGEVPMVFLKQFPSASDPTRACYQAIVESPIRMTKFHGGTPLAGEYSAEFQNYASHPVRNDFGLKPGPQKSLFSFFARLDFLVANGKVLWEAA